jgi:hypothetical protein
LKRKKKGNRVKISFLATVLVLSAAAIISYSFSFGVPSYSVPNDLPPYGGPIGEYAPTDSLQVTYDNFTGIRAENVSAVQNTELLNLVAPATRVNMSQVGVRILITILNRTMNINNSATVAILSSTAFANLSRGFATTNLSPTNVLSFNFYNVTDDSNGVAKHEWMTLDPAKSAVLFAEGGADAKASLTRIVSVREGIIPSVLSQMNVTRMLYVVGGTDHLALAIQAFQGEVRTSQMGVLSVDVVSGHVRVSHVVEFANSSYASSQVGQVQAVYKFASDFSKYEENVRADEIFPFSNLMGAVNLAGE